MKVLTQKNVEFLHNSLIKKFGGISGIRDVGALESAIKSPFQTFDGAELFKNIFEKAACLGFGILQNHPFLDGNKRTALHSMSVFLFANDIALSYNDNEVVELYFNIASGKLGEVELLEWILKSVD